MNRQKEILKKCVLTSEDFSRLKSTISPTILFSKTSFSSNKKQLHKTFIIFLTIKILRFPATLFLPHLSLQVSELLELFLGACSLGHLEHVEAHSLAEGAALAHCHDVPNLHIPAMTPGLRELLGLHPLLRTTEPGCSSWRELEAPTGSAWNLPHGSAHASGTVSSPSPGGLCRPS